jgi:hypothetical protein
MGIYVANVDEMIKRAQRKKKKNTGKKIVPEELVCQ